MNHRKSCRTLYTVAADKATLRNILSALDDTVWYTKVSVCARTVRLIMPVPVANKVFTLALAVAEFSAHLRQTLVVRSCEASLDSSFSRCEKLLVRPGGTLHGHKI